MMDDFFGEPLFQPTGVDWIDHAFTAAILDELDRDEEDEDDDPVL